mmetsp:Transcript_96018/g.200574  ORF Transcript_96018/g.200574 Transcript_96018/m.200574 type:complete len:190 (+) Transcript_96018:161-730(+)
MPSPVEYRYDPRLPFGRLTGMETKLAARGDRSEQYHYSDPTAASLPTTTAGGRQNRRPQSAGPCRSGRWRTWSRCGRAFDDLSAQVCMEAGGFSPLGPKNRVYKEKVVRLIEEDWERKKQEAQLQADGHYKRQHAEQIMETNRARRPISASHRTSVFKDPVLLSTSEAAVKYFMERGEMPSARQQSPKI